MSNKKNRSAARPFKVKVITGLCLSLVLTLGVQFFSFKLNSTLEHTNNSVVHTYEVMNKLDDVNTMLTVMESDIRGYVMSGKDFFSENFSAYKTRIGQNVKAFKKIIADNPKQLEVLRELEPLVAKKIDFTEKVVNVTKAGHADSAQAMIAGGEGKRIMDEIRLHIRNSEAIEKALLTQRIAESKKLASQVNVINTISIILIVILLLASGIIIITDVNKRARLEKDLRENESRLKQFLETLPVGITIVNTAGEIIYSNREAHQIVNYLPAGENVSIADLVKKRSVYKAGTDEPYPSEEMPITLALKGKGTEIEDMELRYGGRTMRLAVNACPVYDSNNKVIYAIAAFTDITQRIKEAEDLARAKDLAEQSVVTKEMFMANMSHEIRTPMNAIIGFTNLLLKTETTEEQKQFVEIIRSSGENLLTIINDILDLSKIQAGMMQFEQIPFSIDPMMNSIKTLLQPKADDKKLDLSLQADPKIPALLVGDPTRLTQVLINLVNNAIKFTEKGFVQVHATLIKDEGHTVWVRISVSDSGVGIAANKLEEIFERFSQATSSTNRKYGGTGLGLSIVKTLAELQGGQVFVKSKEGTGSTFTVEIPYRVASEKELNEYTHEVKNGHDIDTSRKLHLLLVEDNQLNQKLALRVLADMGFTTDLAQNGQEAIDKINSGTRFDVVLMDIQMPLVDGYEATNVIRHQLKNKTPIMAMTAHALSGEKEKCIAAGMNDYISKPFKPRELFDKIYHLAGIGSQAKTYQNEEKNRDTGAVCDLTYLQGLSNGDETFIAEMVDLFYQQVPEEMENIWFAIEQNNYIEVKQIAHKLKSSVLLVGAEIMKDKLVKMEDWGTRQGSTQEVKDLYQELLRLREIAFEELKAYKK